MSVSQRILFPNTGFTTDGLVSASALRASITPDHDLSQATIKHSAEVLTAHVANNIRVGFSEKARAGASEVRAL